MWEDGPETAVNDILEQTDVGGSKVLELFMLEKMWFFPAVRKEMLD